MIIPIGPLKGQDIDSVVQDRQGLQQLMKQVNTFAGKDLTQEPFIKFAPFIDAAKQAIQGAGATATDTGELEVEKDPKYQIPDGLFSQFFSPKELQAANNDVRNLFPNRVKVVLTKLPKNKLDRYGEFYQATVDWLNQEGSGGGASLQAGDANVVPNKEIFYYNDFAKYKLAPLAGQTIDTLGDDQLIWLHRYFTQSLAWKSDALFKTHKAFYDNLTNKVMATGQVEVIDGQYLYPTDIKFYEKYRESKPIGGAGDKEFPMTIKVVTKPSATNISMDRHDRPYWKWTFVEEGTSNVIEYWDYTPPNVKQKSSRMADSSEFDAQMQSMGRTDRAKISADIKGHNKQKGVERTNITNPKFVEKYDIRQSQQQNPEKVAKQAGEFDKDIKIDKEINQMIPKDDSNRIRKDVERKQGEKDQDQKLKDLMGKYKGESKKIEKPNLNEHVNRLLKISNYKKVL